jgi:hypothetical protein
VLSSLLSSRSFFGDEQASVRRKDPLLLYCMCLWLPTPTSSSNYLETWSHVLGSDLYRSCIGVIVVRVHLVIGLPSKPQLSPIASMKKVSRPVWPRMMVADHSDSSIELISIGSCFGQVNFPSPGGVCLPLISIWTYSHSTCNTIVKTQPSSEAILTNNGLSIGWSQKPRSDDLGLTAEER